LKPVNPNKPIITSHFNCEFSIDQVLSNSFLHIMVRIIETKNHLKLTINRGDTSPTAALPAIVLKAQKRDVSINNK
jgi:hypothetical protein